MILHVLSPGEPRASGEYTVAVFTEAAAQGNVSVKTLVQSAELVPTILYCAREEEVDLIVMGANVGKHMSDWLSREVLQLADIPVETMPYQMESSSQCAGQSPDSEVNPVGSPVRDQGEDGLR